eukprot:2780361-Alexandrium_andersonii.AAC.1
MAIATSCACSAFKALTLSSRATEPWRSWSSCSAKEPDCATTMLRSGAGVKEERVGAQCRSRQPLA